MEKFEEEYKEYVNAHRNYVKKAFEILKKDIKNNLGLSNTEFQGLLLNIEKHDLSKFSEEEFGPYSIHFFGNRTKESDEEFEKAALFHALRNPHHIEYWARKNKMMPKIYIVEMVCDFWSFGLKNKNPYEIFDWLKKHQEKFNSDFVDLDFLKQVLNFVALACKELERNNEK